MTIRVIVTHRVRDYDEWHAHFEAAAHLRSAAGELSFEVLRAAEDPNLIVHLATWTSTEEARAFFESEEVAAIRTRAGVASPDFGYFTIEARNTTPL